jgi:DMSO/TMAO reductase YedYZ molybdopterin-dependent catalytic subunit
MTRRGLLTLALGAAALVLTPTARTVAAQQAAAGPLLVNGDVAKPLSLMPADLKTLPRTKVEARAEDGKVNTYEGVLAGELLKMAGVPLGQMRGGAAAAYIVATATDGYQAIFGGAEFDPAIGSQDVIVADTINGQPLPASQGPLRLVAPGDRRGVRAVRMLQRIEVVSPKK